MPKKMDKKIKIIIADDHEMIREGIKSTLKDYLSYEFVAEVASGRDLLKVLKRFRKTDILLLNYDMPPKNGFEILYKVTLNFPDIKVVMLSMSDDMELQVQSIKLGAKAFLLKTFSTEELIETLVEVHKNGLYVKDQISSKLDHKAYPLKLTFNAITEREQEILKELDKGKTEAEIALTFGISKATVHTHKNSLLKKTNTHNTAQLLKEAMKRGLI